MNALIYLTAGFAIFFICLALLAMCADNYEFYENQTRDTDADYR